MNNSSTFCTFPFVALATREDGMIKACCRSHPIGDISKESLEDIWNGDTMKRIRKQVLNSERPPECSPCFVLEDQGVESYRQRHTLGIVPESNITLYPNCTDNMNSDYSMPFEIPTMELKLNNLCNLKCRMCHPVDSTSWNDFNTVRDFFEKENNIVIKAVDDFNLTKKPYLDLFEDNVEWWENFDRLLPYFRRVEFAGGEPLMDPQHYKILEKLKPYAHQIELKIATNLTVLGIGTGKRNIFEYWPHFKSVVVQVSIDGVGDVYEYIRSNASWQILVDNIHKIKSIPSVTRIMGQSAIQANNVLTLDKMIEYILDELDIQYWSNFVRYPTTQNCQVLPEPLKQLAVDRLTNVKSRLSTFKFVKRNINFLPILESHIDNIITFVQSEDHNSRWVDFVEYNRRLDKSRLQGPFEVINPEFKDYV
jgi:hypothetical protein